MKKLRKTITKKVNRHDDEERFRSVMEHFWGQVCSELRGTFQPTQKPITEPEPKDAADGKPGIEI